MPPNTSPRDHTRRYQPTGQRPPVRDHPPAPSRLQLPQLRPPSFSQRQNQLYPRQQAILDQHHHQQSQASSMSYMTTRTSSRNSFSYDFRPYPQPRIPPGPNALPSLTNLFPPPPRAPPPHVLPPTPPAFPLLPQHAPPPGPRRPITPDPDENLKRLAMAALGPEVWAYRRIKKATVPKNSASGLPHFAPPAGPPPPSMVLPPVSALLETPPPATAEETMKRIAEMDDDDTMSTSTVRAPAPAPALGLNHSPNVRSPSVSRRSSPVTHSSDHSSGSQGHSQSGSRASPISTSSTQSVTKKRHLFGDTPPEGQIPRSEGPLAGLCLSGPSSPERAKASQDWHEASRRMLHPRSVWSPPTPISKLPELPLISDRHQTGSHSPKDGGEDEGRPAKRATPPKRTSISPPINSRIESGEASPKASQTSRDSLEDQPAKVSTRTKSESGSPPHKPIERIIIDSPTPHSPPPELMGDMSQETSFSASAPLITPNSSFSVDPLEQKGEEESTSATTHDTGDRGLSLSHTAEIQVPVVGLEGDDGQTEDRG